MRQIAADLPSRIRSIGRHCLACIHRARRSSVTFVGITGSAGKTTTKTLAHAILSAQWSCRSSPGGANEHYDVEHTVLNSRQDDQVCVVEVGAPNPGYLDRSLRALRPKIGVLTLIAREHYSAFRSLEAIAAEKGKLIAALPPDGIAVLNRDDPHVRAIGERHAGRIVWVGRDEGATIRLLGAHSTWPDTLSLRVVYQDTSWDVATRLHGNHLAMPVLCALGVAVAAGMAFPDAVAALLRAEPVQGRMQVDVGDDGVAFVRDDWKAPHWSFETPLAFMRDARASRKVVVIGSISDSARSPSQRYAWAARRAREVADLVVLIGADARGALKAVGGADDGFHAFSRIEEAAHFLRTALRAGDLVLLKGTNRQDHLSRLLHDRRRLVQCWDDACRRNDFCGGCPMLHAPKAPVKASTSAVLRSATALLPPAVSLPRASPAAVIVGLGNPHPKHRATPHNIGHRVVDALASHAGSGWERQPEGMVAAVELDGVAVELLKPGADINLSGPLVQRFLARVGLGTDRCILIHDDVDLELGSARTKGEGGDGGHRGVQSVVATLQTNRIRRVRVGVRRPGDTRKALDLVLERFSRSDESALEPGLTKAVGLVRAALKQPSQEIPTP